MCFSLSVCDINVIPLFVTPRMIKTQSMLKRGVSNIYTLSVERVIEKVSEKQENKGEHCKGNQTEEKVDYS